MLIDKFLQYIKYEKGYSSHTFISYQTDMNQFVAFVENKKGRFEPKEITATDIREWMVQMLGAAFGLELVDEFFHVLHAVAMRYQQRIGGIDHDQIAHAERGQQTIIAGLQIAVFGIDGDGVAGLHIAVAIARVHAP